MNHKRCGVYPTNYRIYPIDLSLLLRKHYAVNKDSQLDIKQRFGKAIRRRRRELDLSQEELAERAELHRTYLSDIERGEGNPSLEIIEKLAKALDISITSLFADYKIDEKKGEAIPET